MDNYGKATHVAYSDESRHNVGRYRGLGLVTMPLGEGQRLQSALAEALSSSSVKEFHWKKLNGAKMRFAGLKILDIVVPAILEKKMRIDVLTWDTQDERHEVPGRDDIENLHFMYYQLFKNVLRARWPNSARWLLYPDENTVLDWEKIERRLDSVSYSVDTSGVLDPVAGISFDAIRTEFNIVRIDPCKSHEQPLAQVADLFVGMGVYTRTAFQTYRQFAELHAGQCALPLDEPCKALSPGNQERCQVTMKLRELCKKHKLGISLESSGGLKTHNPRNPINYWWYQRQHPEDIAATSRR